jgi:hypothetical protein
MAEIQVQRGANKLFSEVFTHTSSVPASFPRRRKINRVDSVPMIGFTHVGLSSPAAFHSESASAVSRSGWLVRALTRRRQIERCMLVG